MKVSIYIKHGNYYEKEITGLHELTPLEIGGVIKSLFHDFKYVSQSTLKDYSHSIQKNKIEEDIILHFNNIKNKIYANLQLIIKEKHFPRDMTPEKGWDNQIIEKTPFNLDKTLELIYENLNKYSNEYALVKSLNWISTPTISIIGENLENVYKFIEAFKTMFAIIHPEKSWTYTPSDSEDYVQAFRKNELTLNNNDIKVIFDALWDCDVESMELGAKATAWAIELDDTSLKSLEKIIKINASSNSLITILFNNLFSEYTEYASARTFIVRFKSFEKYFNNEKRAIIEHKGLYDSDETIKSRLKKLENDKEKHQKQFIRIYNNRQNTVNNFSHKLNEWMDMFNAFFETPKETKKIYRFEDKSDCKVLHYNGVNLVAVSILNEDSIAKEYRGVLLSNEQLQKSSQSPNKLSEVLLNEWNILGNETEIASTSFHNLDNIISDLNNPKTRSFIFPNAKNEDCVFLLV